jgi:peptidyl-prolyl cis-trans isomerase A (cyclophilin A)
VQQKTLTPSATPQASFTAWLLTGSSVSRHGQVSVAGKTCSQAAYTASSSSALPTVCVITDKGESVLALEPVKAPVTVGNFLRYVNQGFYDQTVFHRFGKVGFGFAQGGGFTHSGSGYVSKISTQAAIALESTLSSGLSNTAGTISMARTNDPDSATAGFFVNTANNSNSFDSRSNRDGYAVFGSFIYGAGTWTAMVDSITAIPGRSDVTEPTPPIALQWAYQIK